MKKQTTFPTVSLEEIRHLIPQAENSDADTPNAIVCRNCGHPAGDHSIENDTCWHVDQRDDTVKICNCQGWLFEQTAEPAAS